MKVLTVQSRKNTYMHIGLFARVPSIASQCAGFVARATCELRPRPLPLPLPLPLPAFALPGRVPSSPDLAPPRPAIMFGQ